MCPFPMDTALEAYLKERIWRLKEVICLGSYEQYTFPKRVNCFYMLTCFITFWETLFRYKWSSYYFSRMCILIILHFIYTVCDQNLKVISVISRIFLIMPLQAVSFSVYFAHLYCNERCQLALQWYLHVYLCLIET